MSSILDKYVKEISDLYNIDHDSLLKYSEKFFNKYIIGLKGARKPKYFYDEDFFTRENEASFYWAGFIAADGCAFKAKAGDVKCLVLSLAEKDLNHLLQFKKDINFEGNLHKSITKHSINNPKWHDSIKYTVCINSTKIFESLSKFNIIPRKTKIYTFPEWLIKHPLVNHFMRGYNDGDGSFYCNKSRDRINFELRGTKEFLDVYLSILESQFDIPSRNTVTTPDSTSKIKISSKYYVPQIVDFLYKDATVFLERKREIAMRAKTVNKVRKRYTFRKKL